MHRELFPRTTGEGFDPLEPGDDRRRRDHRLRAAARSRARAWWRRTRSIRRCPGSSEVIDRLTKATFDAVTASPYEAEVRRAAERVLVDRVTWLATSAPNGQVRAIASLKLQRLAARLRTAGAARARPTWRSTRCSPPTSSASSSGRAPTRRRSCRRRRRRRARRSATSARTGWRAGVVRVGRPRTGRLFSRHRYSGNFSYRSGALSSGSRCTLTSTSDYSRPIAGPMSSSSPVSTTTHATLMIGARQEHVEHAVVALAVGHQRHGVERQQERARCGEDDRQAVERRVLPGRRRQQHDGRHHRGDDRRVDRHEQVNDDDERAHRRQHERPPATSPCRRACASTSHFASPELADSAPSDVTLPIISSVSHAVPRSACFHEREQPHPGQEHRRGAEDGDDHDVDRADPRAGDPQRQHAPTDRDDLPLAGGERAHRARARRGSRCPRCASCSGG